ncbi:hypothetical protein [Sinomonas halotolerans]|uniref:Uncharacterized protein n=1 Tax=Sinomonas halotolerans TaxID=1644133 RepID=A0ABU9WZQ5_9MICC
MSAEDKPLSRRERRRAEAAQTAENAVLRPQQAAAEAQAKAQAEEDVVRAHAEGLAAAHAAADAAARSEGSAGDGRGPEGAGGPGPGEAVTARTRAVRARRALDAPADAVRAEGGREDAAERSSQARARDRAARRALRELAEKEQAVQSAATLPSRRTLREQAQSGPTGAPGPEQSGGRTPAPSSRPGPEPGPSGRPAPAAPQASPAAGPIPVVPIPGEPSAPRPGEDREAKAAPSAPVPGVDPAPPTAMQGVVPDGLTVPLPIGPETGSFRRLSHEQIAQARELLKEQAKNQAAMLEGQSRVGTDIDPAVLAEQVAMAERAAVLNRRAQAKQRLAEENRREASSARKAPAPASTDNLAMVTPLEFVRVPGVPHPVMKPPSTTHLPLSAIRAQAGGEEAESPTGREAAPVAASTAHGLDVLDAEQAGVGRAERERLILLAIGAAGVLALIIAILIIVL